MKNYLLTEKDGETIAVITFAGELHSFYKLIRVAIAEHFCIISEEIDLSIEEHSFEHQEVQMDFEANMINEGDEEVRDFILSEIAVYAEPPNREVEKADCYLSDGELSTEER